MTNQATHTGSTRDITSQGGSAVMGGGDEPRAYAGCLASYNSGILHGRWIRADQDPEDIQAEIDQMLAESPEPGAEEHAYHDYDSLPGLGEFESVETVAKVGQLVAEHGYDLVAGLMGHLSDADEVETALTEKYQGAWDSLNHWACDWFEQTGELQGLPENLAAYFDHEAWARDCELNGDVYTVSVNRSVHIFWSR